MSQTEIPLPVGRELTPGEYGYADLHQGDHYQTPGLNVTESQVVAFAGISGDFFDVHMDDEFAREKGFPGRIAHGLLGLALTDGLKNRSIVRLRAVATLNWNWSFCAPLLPGDHIHAHITVIEKRTTRREDRGIVKFALQLFNQHGKIIQQGETLLMMTK